MRRGEALSRNVYKGVLLRLHLDRIPFQAKIMPYGPHHRTKKSQRTSSSITLACSTEVKQQYASHDWRILCQLEEPFKDIMMRKSAVLGAPPFNSMESRRLWRWYMVAGGGYRVAVCGRAATSAAHVIESLVVCEQKTY